MRIHPILIDATKNDLYNKNNDDEEMLAKEKE